MAEPRFTPDTSKTGYAIVIALLVGGILLMLSWVFRFPWDYLGF